MLTVRLPEEVQARLTRLAETTGRTKSYYVREAILAHLDNMEDLYLAEQRLIDIRAGRSNTVALEDIMQRYDLEN